MQRLLWRVSVGLLFTAGCLAQSGVPQQALTWQETQARFKANNPILSAGQDAIDESRAQETTAFLRPNPFATFTWDQITPFGGNDHPYRPIWQSYLFGNFTYLHERDHKRELRLKDAQQATEITTSTRDDLQRNLTFNLRDAFVRVLMAKAILGVARENLDYWDKQIDINRQRFEAGSMAQIDFSRVELQRLQFASDVETAKVNLRTAKIDLQTLLHDRTPVDQFDVTEGFDFKENLTPLEELRAAAIDMRPDLKEANIGLDKARTDHQLAIANGSTDPTFGVDISHQPYPLGTYIGASMSIPLRIFDRNQGEKLRTQIDITRSQKIVTAAQLAVQHDVDSAYATLESTLQLLRPYKAKYLQQAQDVRSTVTFAYQHGGASLLDFLDAQKEYRDTQLNYLTLVGAYLSAANQVNFAVGREVIQ